MLLPHGTVIAVVDGHDWTLFRNAGNEAAPDLVKVPTPALVEHNHGSGGRHGSSSGNPSPRQLDEDAHAAAVCDWINRQVAAHHVEHLVVIAAPRTLGELRHRYSRQTRSTLIGELAKDLIGKSGPEVVAALRAR